jgi:hypothetical protein
VRGAPPPFLGARGAGARGGLGEPRAFPAPAHAVSPGGAAPAAPPPRPADRRRLFWACLQGPLAGPGRRRQSGLGPAGRRRRRRGLGAQRQRLNASSRRASAPLASGARLHPAAHTPPSLPSPPPVPLLLPPLRSCSTTTSPASPAHAPPPFVPPPWSCSTTTSPASPCSRPASVCPSSLVMLHNHIARLPLLTPRLRLSVFPGHAPQRHRPPPPPPFPPQVMLHNDIALSRKIQSEIRLMLSFKHENIVEVGGGAGAGKTRGLSGSRSRRGSSKGCCCRAGFPVHRAAAPANPANPPGPPLCGVAQAGGPRGQHVRQHPGAAFSFEGGGIVGDVPSSSHGNKTALPPAGASARLSTRAPNDRPGRPPPAATPLARPPPAGQQQQRLGVLLALRG